ncbi:MAG: ROK family protein [Peptostreptococcaceae bacterium]|nr:ROK family protein [Peptostreptococcaceae bacterium]
MKYIAIDIGGTKLKHGLIDEAGNILERTEIPSEAHRGGAHLVELVLEICHAYVQDHKIEGIGISTAGMVDPEKGEIIYSGKQIPEYSGTKWKRIIEDEFKVPCEVENDVNCAGLSEALIGAGRGCSPCVCITVGTGIGACMIVDGKIFHGASGSAFEVGYMNMGDGIYQDKASTTALVENVAEKLNILKGQIDGRWIFERAKQGDPVCNEAIDDLMENLAFGISNICYVANPQVVILGGGIMEQAEFLKPRLDRAIEKMLLDFVRKNTEFTFAANGNNAGMLGAFFNLKNKMEKKDQ